MIIRSTLLALGASLALAALQPALADRYEHIERDIGEVRHDRHVVTADEARLAHERVEAARAHARAHEAFEHGHIVGAIREGAEARREEREAAAAARKLQEDRANLNADRHDLHEDLERHHRS